MLAVYPSEQRGMANFGWHVDHYTFTFGTHYCPTRRGIGPLCSLNEHRALPNEEFAWRSHRDMELVTYVGEGDVTSGQRIKLQANKDARLLLIDLPACP